MTGLHLRLYNTLTGRKEVFEPLSPGAVRIYVCGITPYDETHLGHARCYVFFDTVRRTLIQSGFQVTYIQNFTDIDDKIIARAQSLGRAPQAVADQFIADYFSRTSLLGILPADRYPRVTQVVPEIVRFIEGLVQKGLAYPSGGDVFYSVEKFGEYGKLSKRDIKDMEAGARVDVNENKRNPLDFALWKSAKPGEPFWDSPWGKGRPGWHIECSVMSINNLGESFDLHGGGQDLIFPHHENEIAQSEGLTGKPFAKYWLHNGFVTVNREKMSKSLGNFFTLREIFEKVPPAVVRLFLLSRHYRTPLDFSDDLLDQAKSSYRTLSEVMETSFFLLGEEDPQETILEDWKKDFLESLSDDFNTEKAISVLFELRNQIVEKIAARDLPWLRRARATLRVLCEEFLGIQLERRLTAQTVESLKGRLEARQEARRNKDWNLADRIRDEIAREGYAIEDTAQGPLLKPSSS